VGNWWDYGRDDSDEQNIRGRTRVGQTGWIAWLDNGHKRNVGCEFGKCIVAGDYPNGMVEIQTETQVIRCPHGRLDFNPVAALVNLSTDLKIEGDSAIGKAQEAMAEAIKRHQAEIDKISRVLLLDLVAVEQAKHAKYPEPSKGRVGQSVPKIEQTPKRIEGKRQ
jgi:hypothetical protein